MTRLFCSLIVFLLKEEVGYEAGMVVHTSDASMFLLVALSPTMRGLGL